MNLFENIFDKFTKQAQPVPSFGTPQAPRTNSYVAPNIPTTAQKVSQGVRNGGFAPGYEGTVDETKGSFFQGLQGIQNVVRELPKALEATAQSGKKQFEQEMSQKRQQFISDMLAQGYKKDDIFQAMDNLQAKGEFDFKPGISGNIVGGLGERIGNISQTTERLSQIDNPLDRAVAGVLPYAGQTVATALQPITSAIEPYVSPVVQKIVQETNQTERLQDWSNQWSQFEKTNPILAENIAGLLNVSQLAPVPFAKPIANATGNVVKQTGKSIVRGAEKVAPKVVQGTKNIITKTPEFIGNTIGSTAEYGTSLATGLSKESQQIIKKSPELYKQARLGDISSEGELGNFAKATEARLTDLSELGKGYDSIRKGATVSNADEISNIYLNRTKEIPTTQLTKADKIVLKDASDYMSQLKGDLKDSDILALRKQLDSISYDPNTGMKRKLSPQGARLVEGMRSDVDIIAKNRIKGLKELDTKYAPEVKLLKEIKSSIYDSNGNIKNNALSTISNIVGKNKDLKLAKFEEIYPDLGKRLRALKAYEEVSSIASLKTGSIVRQLGGATVGTALAPGLGTIVGFIATNPHIVARILEAYGMVTSKAKSIVEKGSKITPQEVEVVKEALKKVPKDKVEDIITNIKFNPKTENKNSKTLIKNTVDKKPTVKPNSTTNAKQQVIKPASSDTIPEGYFKNAFGEIQKNPSNKKGGFIRNPFAKPEPKRLFAGENSAQPPKGKTGWFKGADGKMRFEIDDSQATFNTNTSADKNGYIKLDKILSHNELFRQYPELKNIDVRIFKNDTESSFLNDQLPLGPGEKRGVILLGIKDKTIEQQKSTLLHEIQHAIQNKEGFAKGGSTDMFKNEIDQFLSYQKLSGEVEARNVQSRMNLTAKERTLKSPESTEDVPRSKQIIRMDSKGPSMLIKGDEALIQEAKKYKTADEFIKAQGEPVYHGTNAEFDSFDINLTGKASKGGESGIFLTTDKKLAEGYANQAYTSNTSNNKELFSMRIKRKELEKKSDDLFKTNKELSRKYAREAELLGIKIYDKISELEKLPQGKFGKPKVMNVFIDKSKLHTYDAKGMNFEIANDEAIAQAKKLGKEGVIIKRVKDNPKGFGITNESESIVIFNPESIKTESQLKQIYEQATKPKSIKGDEALMSEARKPSMGDMETKKLTKSDEELIKLHTSKDYIGDNKGGKEIDTIKALQKLPDYVGTVYEGIGRNIEGISIGDTIPVKSIKSASEKLSVAKEWATGSWKQIFKINTKNGKKISQFSYYPNEAEVALAGKGQYKITGIKNQGGYEIIEVDYIPEIKNFNQIYEQFLSPQKTVKPKKLTK